jgi:hypothetical protein
MDDNKPKVTVEYRGVEEYEVASPHCIYDSGDRVVAKYEDGGRGIWIHMSFSANGVCLPPEQVREWAAALVAMVDAIAPQLVD